MASTRTAILNCEERPLEQLSGSVATEIAARSGRVSLAIWSPSSVEGPPAAEGGVVYVLNGDERYALASVVKVPILLTFLNQLLQEERTPTDDEHQQIEALITVSSNDAATALWDKVGGGEGVGTYIQSLGLDAFDFNQGPFWGNSTCTVRQMATLLALLATKVILDVASCDMALDLMSRVVPEQRWGVADSLPSNAPDGTGVALKNGWYPMSDGWRLNSTGVVLPPATDLYSIAYLTDQQPEDAWPSAYGISTIESSASTLHHLLLKIPDEPAQ